MSNIPLLNKQRTAKAQTNIVDRSGLVAAEQRGIKEFGKNIQKILKTSTEIIDSKIYESESANSQKEILGFMSEANSEKDKSDYFAKNKTLAGFHTHRARKNLDNIQKRLSNISHPRARKELERKLTFQAEKAMVGDLADENRSLKIETNLKEQDKNHILGVEVMGMKSPSNAMEFKSTVQKRLNDIDKQVSEGLMQGSRAELFKVDVKDTANTLRARALVEGGNPLSAIKHVRQGDFGTLQARNKAESYVKSKQLDGFEKSYKHQKARNNLIKAENEAVTLELDRQVQAIQLDDNLSDSDKLAVTNDLMNKYKSVITSKKQFNIFNNANIRTSRNMVNRVMSNVNNIAMDQTDTALFRGSIDALRGMSTNPHVPSKIQKQATNAMNNIVRKQEAHEKIVERDAYRPLLKAIGGKRRHETILNKITNNPKYKDLPVEGKVEVYELLRDSKDKKTLNLKTIETRNEDVIEEPYTIEADKALELYRKDSTKFASIIKRAIRRKKYNGWITNRNVSEQEANKLFSQFKKSFDDYRQKTDNFESLESQILNKYIQNTKVADK